MGWKDRDGQYLREWAWYCVQKIETMVKNISAEFPGNYKFYLATDLANSAMQGGDMRYMNAANTKVVDELRANMTTIFPGGVILDGMKDLVGVRGDIQGMAALTDLAVSVKSTHFVSMYDSFTKMVTWERTRLQYSPVHTFRCQFSLEDAAHQIFEFPPKNPHS